jgi:hypothetical protein
MTEAINALKQNKWDIEILKIFNMSRITLRNLLMKTHLLLSEAVNFLLADNQCFPKEVEEEPTKYKTLIKKKYF